jgi:prepilin-type processing-associated H-X9-DG protein
MSARPRRAFSLFQLLLVLAILVLGFALALPALAKVKLAAARVQSANNLKQIGLAAFNYYDANQVFPPGCDANNFSTAAYLLPFIEQEALYKTIDFKKPMDDKANAEPRKAVIRTFLNPQDPVMKVKGDYGPTNYLFNAGSKADLKDNDGMYYLESKTRIADITDGTSQTLSAVETLKGDGMDDPEAPSVARQYVLLKKEDLQGIKDDAGAAFFKEKQHLAGDRCASWMDGRFLQGTFNTRLGIDDARPDVSCGGVGGVSSMRGVQNGVNAGMCDGSVRFISKSITIQTWRAVSTRNGGEVLGSDF